MEKSLDIFILVFLSRLIMIVRISVVLKRTVCGDIDWRFDNLSGSCSCCCCCLSGMKSLILDFFCFQIDLDPPQQMGRRQVIMIRGVGVIADTAYFLNLLRKLFWPKDLRWGINISLARSLLGYWNKWLHNPKTMFAARCILLEYNS